MTMRRRRFFTTVACAVPLGGATLFAFERLRAMHPNDDTPPWEPAPRDAPGYLDEHRALAAAVRAARPRIVFIGDSLCARWRTDGLSVWENDRRLRGAFSLGIGGDTTQNVLWRIANGALDGIEPRVAVVLIGVNDVDRFDAADVARGVLAVVAQVRAALPRARLLLFGILPRGADPREPGRIEIARIDAMLARAPFDANTTYRDIGHAFVDARGRQRPELFAPDAVHLTTAGYARWAAELAPLLASLQGRAAVRGQPDGE